VARFGVDSGAAHAFAVALCLPGAHAHADVWGITVTGDSLDTDAHGAEGRRCVRTLCMTQ